MAATPTTEDELRRRIDELEEREQRLILALTSAEQQERRRMAKIIHNDLQQLLAATKMRLGRAHTKSENDIVRDIIDDSIGIIDETIKVARTISADLRPSILDHEGLLPTLHWLADQLAGQENVRVELQLGDDIDPPQEYLRIFLFESARELLTNTSRHAGTNQATLSLQRQGEDLRLQVRDEGQGFAADSEAVAAGSGLPKLRQRAQAFGGSFDLETSPASGTTVTITIPAPPAQPATT